MDMLMVAMAAITCCLIFKRVKTWKTDGFSLDMPSIGKILIIVGCILLIMA